MLIPFVRMIQIKRFAQFPVDHLAHPVVSRLILSLRYIATPCKTLGNILVQCCSQYGFDPSSNFQFLKSLWELLQVPQLLHLQILHFFFFFCKDPNICLSSRFLRQNSKIHEMTSFFFCGGVLWINSMFIFRMGLNNPFVSQRSKEFHASRFLGRIPDLCIHHFVEWSNLNL